jgi:hypothetical protein
VLANPLRDIGLRSHHALLDRTVPGELKMLFFAIGRIGDGADGQDDFYQSALHTKIWAWSYYAQSIATFQNFDKNFVLSHKMNWARVNVSAEWANSFAASQNCTAVHLVTTLPKPLVLTFDVSVQCFEKT